MGVFLRARKASILIAGVVALVAATGVQGRGQETKTTVVMPPGPLLPQRFGGWTILGTLAAGDAGTCGAVSGGDPTVLKEYGVERTADGVYSSGAGQVRVRALQFGDATGAAGAFT